MRQIILTVMVVIGTACSHNNQISKKANSCTISYIDDITDPLLLEVTAAPLLALYDFPHDKNKEAWFRMQSISDLRMGPVLELHLPDGTGAERQKQGHDGWYREKLIQGFYRSVAEAIQGKEPQGKTQISLKHSECFGKIIGELNHLAKYPGQKILIIRSDLKENSDEGFNSYHTDDIKLAKNSPDSVAATFLRRYPLPTDLSSFRVYFLYLPKDRRDEKSFLIMEKIYERILLKRGATVSLQSNTEWYK